MRKFFLILSTFFCIASYAQQVPQGMKYQAVARNLKGEVLINEIISLQIRLTSQPQGNRIEHYSEIHNVTTNELGLFSLVIGEGKGMPEKFRQVPWEQENIWMEVAIMDRNRSDFTIISNSRLLAVPYAFHAATAGQLVNSGSTEVFNVQTGGVNSQVWSLFGNSNVNAATQKLGTTDVHDLVIVTNDQERMRVLANGNINVVHDLNVSKNVVLNSSSEGITTINGNLTVLNEKPTSLSGILTVEKITRLNDPTESTTKDNGALVVEGGAGIEKNVNVGGDLTVGGNTTMTDLEAGSIYGNSLNVTNNSAGYLASFINTNNGSGSNAGDGIKIQLGKEKPLDLGNNPLPTFSNFLPGITGALNNSVFSNGTFNTSLTSETFFNNLYQGATTDILGFASAAEASLCQLTNVIIGEVNKGLSAVNTGLELPNNLSASINSGLHLPYNFTTPINSGLGLPFKVSDPINNTFRLPLDLGLLGEIPKLPLIELPTLPAVSIPALPSLILPAIPEIPVIPNCPQIVNPFSWSLSWPTVNSNPLTKHNEFVGFYDSNGEKVGAIRGQSLQDFIAAYTDIPQMVDVAATFINAFDLDALTPDPFSVVRIGARAVNHIISTWDKVGKIGVEYSSGNGDYAEWLERENPEEIIGTGDIVAVKGGKITKDIEGAEQIMAVSYHPIVLGNVPDKDKVESGNNIAFMGQIPVKIIGPVKAGDFIVAKGNIPGYGIAIDPKYMQIEDYKLVVGRSWASDHKPGLKMVNTVVGVHNNSFLDIIRDIKLKTEENDERLKVIESRLNIVPSTKDNKFKKQF
jgi:hypothetical protein